jgi:hypothetical protein
MEEKTKPVRFMLARFQALLADLTVLFSYKSRLDPHSYTTCMKS